MPLVKRSVAPRHLCHGAVPVSVDSELECVTNNTLSAIIRQLSSLSQHAENVFGELFNEANTFYVRANDLQERMDRLAVKVTQLDSSVEEVSLQDINMRKGFRSSALQDQQVVGGASLPHCVAQMYGGSDRPPPLSALTPYREDSVEAMNFYSDPSYFFELWKEKMLQDTEEKRTERRRLREQRRRVEGVQRHAKKGRKDWNLRELRPDHRHPHTLGRGVSSEGSLSPDGRPELFDPPVPPLPSQVVGDHSGSHDRVPAPPQPSQPVEHEYHSIDLETRRPTVEAPPHSPSVPGFLIPLSQTAFGSPLGSLPPTAVSGAPPIGPGYPLPPLPPSGPGLVPSPPPLPPPAPPSHPAGHRHGNGKPVRDARSDLLSAIRMGIQLKKVQEQQEQQSQKEPLGNDVATILSRRIAVEYSESEEDSELEDHDWSD